MQPTTLQNYRLLRLLGEGGMGEVWLAEHTHLGRQVAIKCLHPQLLRNEGIRARFKQEANTLARLQHPGIVALHDYIEDDGAAYLVMEYVEGVALDEYINQKSGPIPDAQLHDLFKQILEAFSYAHGRKVVHRDIKPGNFMLTPDGRIKVLDFGIAKVLEQTDHRLTKNGTRMGTVLYMSPEQVKGNEVDQRSDIYSLGVLLYQMATGQCPYDHDATEFVVYEQIVHHALPSASQIYPGVTTRIERLIAKATAKHPDERYQDCQAFLEALMQPGLAEAAPSPSTPVKASQPAKKRSFTAWYVVAGAAVLMIIAYMVYSNFNRGNAGKEWGSEKNRQESASTERENAEKRRREEAKRKETADREQLEREKKQTRRRFQELITAQKSTYTIGFLGGISDLSVTVTNDTDYRIDGVQVDVSYIKASGETYNVESLVFHDIRKRSSKKLKAPDSERGTSVTLAISVINSRDLELCYDAYAEFEGEDESTHKVPDDPYRCVKR